MSNSSDHEKDGAPSGSKKLGPVRDLEDLDAMKSFEHGPGFFEEFADGSRDGLHGLEGFAKLPAATIPGRPRILRG